VSQTTALALTWGIELVVAGLLTARRDLRFFLVVFAASLVTHPVVWWVGSSAPPGQWWPRIIAVEAVVAVLEGIFIRFAAREPAGLRVGLVMNATSFAVGLVIAPFL
jgi:hypothetical protein